ncbi:hypothetical protein L1987_08948 [Smallanthus sonchifolius]|uniref:Uncharacterized protein n=1 Tax=Smallanthus sonchifolius TaxID=185202 RepID=A0ACB9JNQ8_9ASTR|nr:hypothetical protein L1987_08948 [Smallanthus sonchifolius]
MRTILDIVAHINSNVNPNNAIPGNANLGNIKPGNANMGNAMGNNNAVPQIRGMVKSAMPSTFQEMVKLVRSLTNDMVRNGTLWKSKSGDKRK